MFIDDDGKLFTLTPKDESDEDLLMIAQFQGRPHDPVLYREIMARGLVGYLDLLERREQALARSSRRRGAGGDPLPQ